MVPGFNDEPGGLRGRSWKRLWGERARLGGHEGRDRAPTISRALLPAHATDRTADTGKRAAVGCERLQRVQAERLADVEDVDRGGAARGR